MTTLDNFYSQVRAARPLDPILLDKPIALEALQTPALVIDLDVFERNLQKMQSYLSAQGIALRSHTKMHKCPVIARKQVEAGARGVCAAKVSEAEIMCDAGIDDVLVTSPLATRDKVDRFIGARKSHSGIKLVVDHEQSATLLNDSAGAEGLSVDVFIDIDPGMGRTGVEAGEGMLRLAEFVCAAEHLKLAGIQMYAGNCMHIEGFQDRQAKYTKVMQKGIETLALLQDNGIEVPIVSGGGTGTYNMEAELGLINELQAGSYAFMDIEYRDIGGRDSGVFSDFEVSLFVLVTAISQPQSRLITVDGGFKSFASDKMPPQFRDVEGVIYHWGGDEHGIIQLDNPSREVVLGDKLAMLTPHCDPTVNLHDFYFPYRDGLVHEIWPVSARGFAF
ncbi:MAG: DSD1 family PLP-dependent enzyme [Pseudomonadales bacterium]|jgi:3-hydroxy-D-aspartate aldolase|nr:DSD1 family PLP-dependent enzyme [Pseudomonadales bacterium]